jgi:AraC-like DNA-binding protein
MCAELSQSGPIASPRGEALRAAFPWVSSRTLKFTAQGEFPLAFPQECPLLLHCLQFTVEHRLTPSYHEHLEISYAAGFSSHSYFDRVFKRLKGVTPQEYRRQLKV